MSDPSPKPPAPIISTPEIRRKQQDERGGPGIRPGKRLWVIVLGVILLLALPVVAVGVFVFSVFG